MQLLFQSLPSSCLRLQRGPGSYQNLACKEGEHFTVTRQLSCRCAAHLCTKISEQFQSETIQLQRKQQSHINVISWRMKYHSTLTQLTVTCCIIMLNPAPPLTSHSSCSSKHRGRWVFHLQTERYWQPSHLCTSRLHPVFPLPVCACWSICVSQLYTWCDIHPSSSTPPRWLLSRLIPQTCHTSPASALPVRQRRGVDGCTKTTPSPPNVCSCCEY